MPSAIKTRIVRVGNSQGIRIPKLLLEQADLGEEVELEVQGEQIVIRPAHPARHGWDRQFKAMAESGDDKLLDGDIVVSTVWDEEEWEW
jgi:antitoxin MazE